MSNNEGWVRVRYKQAHDRDVPRSIFLAKVSEVLSPQSRYIVLHNLNGEQWGLATAAWLEIVDE